MECIGFWPGSSKARSPRAVDGRTGYELDVTIAAVVLCGTSLAGSKGRIVGTLIGADLAS